MIDFAAIDFETANENLTSVCSVGVVVVRKGKMVEKLYRLIRPYPDRYLSRNTQVHGLTQADTASAPNFPDVWEELTPHIEGLPLVAHNSPFDEGCLRAVHELYGMTYPSYRFYCTCKLSRKAHKGLVANHRLPTVSAFVGYNLTQHHHALADAEACAAIALTLNELYFVEQLTLWG